MAAHADDALVQLLLVVELEAWRDRSADLRLKPVLELQQLCNVAEHHALLHAVRVELTVSLKGHRAS